MENVYIKDNFEVPVVRKLAFLCEREKDIKSFIGALGTKYSDEIDSLMAAYQKKQAKELLYSEQKSKSNISELKSKTKKTAHKYTKAIQKKNSERSLFSPEAASRILNHETDYKIDEE